MVSFAPYLAFYGLVTRLTNVFYRQNAVEEYVYDIRAKLSEELEKYVSEEESSGLRSELNATEDWLYEDGEDCAKQIYVDKLDFLRVSLTLSTVAR